jgi:hypothetical protein
MESYSGEHARPGRGRSRPGFANLFQDRFGETPKPTPETGVLPGKNALRLATSGFVS